MNEIYLRWLSLKVKFVSDIKERCLIQNQSIGTLYWILFFSVWVERFSFFQFHWNVKSYFLTYFTHSHQNHAIELSALDYDDCRYESWWLLLITVLKSENIKSDIDNLSEMTNVKKKPRIYLTLSFIVSKISILAQIYR